MAILNVYSRSSDWRARRLSNFSPDPIRLDGQEIQTVEGLIQGIKFPEGDSRRQQAFTGTGAEAKRLGASIQARSIYWQGQEFPFGSLEHRLLIERAIRAKFEQNPEARAALKATQGLTLIHDLGEPDDSHTSLPHWIFCNLLTEIRSRLE